MDKIEKDKNTEIIKNNNFKNKDKNEEIRVINISNNNKNKKKKKIIKINTEE